MIKKIEKITRIKGIDFDVGNKYNEQHDGKDSAFETTLKRVINKKSAQETSKIPEAYSLDIASMGGQSLFYMGGTDFRALLG